MTYTAIVDTVVDCGCVRGFEFAECFSELEELGHILKDTVDGENYYMIADTGTLVARELRSSIEPQILEKASIAAARHLALASLGVVLNAQITETEDGRYRVGFHIGGGENRELLNLSVTVSTRKKAEQIKNHCECTKPEDIYRAILSVVTGEIGYYL
jgi:hypothetical protein